MFRESGMRLPIVFSVTVFCGQASVIDAYTDRMVRCIGVTEKKDRLKCLFEQILPADNHIYKQAHAHIVEYAKEFCGKKRCAECILVSSSE